MNLHTSDVSTTKMTSKGQVVIPEEIREHLHLESGVKFIVMAMADSIIFKKINPIPDKDIKSLLKASKNLAKKYALKESEVSRTICEVRRSKNKKSKGTSKATTKE